MRQSDRFYIAGRWIQPFNAGTQPLINPADGQVSGHVSLAAASDVDRAVRSARTAFPEFSQTSPQWRADLLRSITSEYQRRIPDLAEAVIDQLGAPSALAHGLQVNLGKAHFSIAADALASFAFAETRGTTTILREPIGVCGLITPWNWPLNQLACKIAPALAAGCTMVLKPSELTPAVADLLAEILHTAGVPAGVFNLVHGTGAVAGHALAVHPYVDMVSITGSRAAGAHVAAAAAPTVKRVHQELGGKSPFVVLDDDAFPDAVSACVAGAMTNSGQSCNAPTQLLVPAHRIDEAAELCRHAVEKLVVGDPRSGADVGPVISSTLCTRIQRHLETAIADGARLVTGGPGTPTGMNSGFYVRPTVFTDVTRSMTVAREEIFGPVLAIMGYRGIGEAIDIANDTDYGLAGYVWGQDDDLVKTVVASLRVGQVRVNGAPGDLTAPFGGYKHSGNGREWGASGITEYLETKSIMTRPPA